MGLPSGNLVRAYNKGKERELYHGNCISSSLTYARSLGLMSGFTAAMYSLQEWDRLWTINCLKKTSQLLYWLIICAFAHPFSWKTYNCSYILNHGIKWIASIVFEARLGAGKFVMFPYGITKCICLIYFPRSIYLLG